MIQKLKNTYIIAEIGVNHNGKISVAKKMILAAKKCGADAVKFQSFKSENLVTKSAEQAPYQIRNTGKKEKQIKMLKNFELKNDDYYTLKQVCKKLKIDFISSVFDEESADFLCKYIKPKIIKIPSGEITNYFLLKKLDFNKNIILLSTGMSNYKEIVTALNTIAKQKVFTLIQKSKINIVNKKIFLKIKKRICLMHCVTDYPVSSNYANLECVRRFGKDFKLIIGYSDHTKGTLAPIIAISKGAKIIEKHFTLNKKSRGPDHLASLNPVEFKKMVNDIRLGEKMFGDGVKKLENCEIINSKVARKSLVAKKNISLNEKFSYANVTAKRPWTGLNPFNIINLINKKAKKNYLKDDII